MKLLQILRRPSSFLFSRMKPTYLFFSYTSDAKAHQTTSTDDATSLSLTQEELSEINLLLPRLCSSNHIKEATKLIAIALLTPDPNLDSLPLPIFIETLSTQPDLTHPMYLLNTLKHSTTPTKSQSFTIVHLAKMLVHSFFQQGQPKKALKIFQWVSRPDFFDWRSEFDEFYGVLVHGFCREGMVMEALMVVKVMVENNLAIGEEIGMLVYRGLLREARINQALQLKKALESLKIGGEEGHEKKVVELLAHMIANWV